MIRTRLLAFAALMCTLATSAGAATVATAGDAAISRDDGAGSWTLTAGAATLTLGVSPSRDLAILDLRTTNGVPWIPRSGPDSFVHTSRQTVPLGSRNSGFALRGVTVDTEDSRLQLNATFEFASGNLIVTRHYAVASGSSAFEVWTTFAPLGDGAVVGDLNAFVLPLAVGPVHWLTGLQGDSADVSRDSAFTLQSQTLSPGATLSLRAAGRASEQTVPWFAIDGQRDEFFAALMWSGAWSLGVDRSGNVLNATFGLGPMTTTLHAPVDGPHAVFGVVPGGMADASAALRSYVLTGIRRGRPLHPLVTYNTWFAYGTGIDEGSMLAEMDGAAALGVELFVVDAGWYAGAGADGPFDFEAGLGSWQPDPARFPNGFGPLADHAHALGMKFGLWVEPERTNLSLVGADAVDERWLAMRDGDYGSGRFAQICLANDAARDYVFNQLTGLLDAVPVDYLKWDNNFWINCNRDGHGHGDADGNFAHVSALYQMLGALRDRYPEMLIENVSGGGNRLDLGMLRYTDAAWMDDRTAPSVHVRHNVEGLAMVFPPAYLLSFVTDDPAEPMHDSPDLSLYFRSRMVAALGLCVRSADFSEGDVTGMTHEIDIYKGIRDTLATASAALLTTQARVEDGPAWDVLQESDADGVQVLLSAFQTDPAVDSYNITPAGLSPDDTYDVVSVDAGPLGSATGADLMSNGIDVVTSPVTAAHILVLRKQ